MPLPPNTQCQAAEASLRPTICIVQCPINWNSIINSPLNTDAQEKLVKFLEYPVEDTARQKALFFLDDLKKEINYFLRREIIYVFF